MVDCLRSTILFLYIIEKLIIILCFVYIFWLWYLQQKIYLFKIVFITIYNMPKLLNCTYIKNTTYKGWYAYIEKHAQHKQTALQCHALATHIICIKKVSKFISLGYLKNPP